MYSKYIFAKDFICSWLSNSFSNTSLTVWVIAREHSSSGLDRYAHILATDLY